MALKTFFRPAQAMDSLTSSQWMVRH